jgi:hypothetical protein
MTKDCKQCKKGNYKLSWITLISIYLLAFIIYGHLKAAEYILTLF